MFNRALGPGVCAVAVVVVSFSCSIGWMHALLTFMYISIYVHVRLLTCVYLCVGEE